MYMSNPPIGPSDASISPRYAGIATFARLPRLEDVGHADIVVVGVPFDSGVSYRPGARFGPAHVREASRLLRPYNPVQDVEPFSTQQIADAGDIAANPFNIEEAVEQIEAEATRLGAGDTRLLTIGGDHTRQARRPRFHSENSYLGPGRRVDTTVAAQVTLAPVQWRSFVGSVGLVAVCGALTIARPAHARGRKKSERAAAPSRRTAPEVKLRGGEELPGTPTATTATTGAPPSRGPTRIDFDDRLIQGQTNKSGAVYLYDRKELKTRSMIRKREGFREEIIGSVYDG